MPRAMVPHCGLCDNKGHGVMECPDLGLAKERLQGCRTESRALSVETVSQQRSVLRPAERGPEFGAMSGPNQGPALQGPQYGSFGVQGSSNPLN